MIRGSAVEFGVEPALIFAVCEVESHFNPRALSPTGAVGIMQIMPSTGEWIASRLGVADYHEEDLYDPTVNVRFGTYYLSYLGNLFSEEWQIIAGYNAGEGAVRSWIEGGLTEADVPYMETSSYLRKVKRALSYYRHKKIAAFD